MRADAAGKNRIAIVQQMLRCDGGCHAAARAADKFDGPRRGDVFEHHGQRGESLEQGRQHSVDEMRFAIEHVNVALR